MLLGNEWTDISIREVIPTQRKSRTDKDCRLHIFPIGSAGLGSGSTMTISLLGVMESMSLPHY